MGYVVEDGTVSRLSCALLIPGTGIGSWGSGFQEFRKVLDLEGGFFHDSGYSLSTALSISGASSTEFLSYMTGQSLFASP